MRLVGLLELVMNKTKVISGFVVWCAEIVFEHLLTPISDEEAKP